MSCWSCKTNKFKDKVTSLLSNYTLGKVHKFITNFSQYFLHKLWCKPLHCNQQKKATKMHKIHLNCSDHQHWNLQRSYKLVSTSNKRPSSGEMKIDLKRVGIYKKMDLTLILNKDESVKINIHTLRECWLIYDQCHDYMWGDLCN